MREIHDFKVTGADHSLRVTVMDKPGSGGACHHYAVSCDANEGVAVDIVFQNGPIGLDGKAVNGLTHEVLLSIVADRLRCFQEGPYSCKANASALIHVEEALHWLQQRTIERVRRGVEGTHAV